MQVQAILEAACELQQEEGITVQLEIMVPLIGDVKELVIVKRHIHEVAERVMRAKGVRLSYLVGTMIELPRAVLTAGAIAREADFFVWHQRSYPDDTGLKSGRRRHVFATLHRTRYLCP